MIISRSTAGWIFAGALTATAIAQASTSAVAEEQYVPRLGDIMSTVQSRHMKLWFAGKSLNWGLAAYELDQIKRSLVEAASLYTGIPVTNINTMGDPVQAIADAIQAHDSRRFSQAFGQMTNGCNSCHQSMERGFVTIRVPDSSPFPDQVFTPQKRP